MHAFFSFVLLAESATYSLFYYQNNQIATCGMFVYCYLMAW